MKPINYLFCFVLFFCLIIKSNQQQDQCKSVLVETIPIGLTYNTTIKSSPTFETLINLISSANESIDIASFYWSLFGTDVMPKPDNSSIKGKLLFDSLIEAGKKRKIKTRIVVNRTTINSTDLNLLSEVAEIRQLNFLRLIGAGVLHTKFVIIDNKHLYLGSANMDWRALTHVKELGISITHCGVLANDLNKIFQVYWYLGQENATIPKTWPKEYETKYNMKTPLPVRLNNLTYNVALSSAPREFNPTGRTNDIDLILYIIRQATKFVCISVMDYIPALIYTKNIKYWPVIDQELKIAAVERKVHVRLLISKWNHSRAVEDEVYLKSLAAFNNSKLLRGGSIEIKLFIVPATPEQAKIPFSRVNHNKYMVTDTHAFIGTSNWSGDYFVNTAGVSFFAKPVNSNKVSIRNDLESIFNRDWNSKYAHNL